MIVVTGKTGVGKTTLLEQTNLDFVQLDDVVKNVLYKRRSRLYWDIKDEFGSGVVGIFKVNTKKLGQVVLNNKVKLNKLDKIVRPYIETYLNVLMQTNKDAIVEMAVYLKRESWYKKYFDKVVLIDGEQFLDNKFNSFKDKPNPLSNEVVKTKNVFNNKDDISKLIKLLK